MIITTEDMLGGPYCCHCFDLLPKDHTGWDVCVPCQWHEYGQILLIAGDAYTVQQLNQERGYL
jgi:hypothetical protein